MDRVFSYVDELRIDVSQLFIDHAGLRFRSAFDVIRIREQLRKVCIGNEPLSKANVNGRKIYNFELQQPLVYAGREISCVELPESKIPHIYPQDGWEHVEFVLPSEGDTKASIERAFRDRFPHIEHYRTDAPKVAASKDRYPNPAVVLEKEIGLTIKFHPRSLKDVIGA